MIKIENVEVMGWEAAIRGMRNAKNSWDRIDSYYDMDDNGHEIYTLGPNDYDLTSRLAKGGSTHAKFRRMITVYMDITAPLYFWKEFDTYKVGTVANSCSTMHTIHLKEFTMEDFSCEHLETIARIDENGEIHKPYMVMKEIIDCLNACRKSYLETGSKTDWWQMIQLLPSSYNQKRTVMLNYEVIHNMRDDRRFHKLDEWKILCLYFDTLPNNHIFINGKGDVTMSKPKYTWKDIVMIGNDVFCEEFPISGEMDGENNTHYHIDEFLQAVAEKHKVDVDDVKTYMMDNIEFNPKDMSYGAETCGCYINGIAEWAIKESIK